MNTADLVHCLSVQMDVRGHVLAAGKAVLDMMEQDWQPLSARELEHRLDQVVEEILEADLIAKLEKNPPATIYVQLKQNKSNPGPESLTTNQLEEGAKASEPQVTVDATAVQFISDLLQSSKSRTRMTGRAHLSLSHTVLLSLSILFERMSYRSVSQRFQLEKGNIHRIFFSFCQRVNMLQEKQIRWPVGGEAEEMLFPFSHLLGKDEQDEDQGVLQVFGVLGHTRIPIRLPAGNTENDAPAEKRMKKEAHPDSWLNLELVCSRRRQFLHCRISKGSDLDRGKALRDRLKQNPGLIPPGSCLVARSGYPLTAHILTPYKKTSGPKEELFNKTLEEHCQILDHAVASLKTRFKRLQYLDIGNHDRARAVVLTTCVLHNAFVDMGQTFQGDPEKESVLTQEGEEDDEGAHRREAIAESLLKKSNPGRL